MALPVCSSFLLVLLNYMRVVYQWEVSVAEGLWSGRVAGLGGRRKSLAGGAGLSTIPGWVRLSTIPGWVRLSTCGGRRLSLGPVATHRWTGSYGYATEAHRDVMTSVGAVGLDWPSQAAEVFGGAS